jgi:hypothetical protein
MSTSYIPKALRERVAIAARHRCGYCLTQERIIGAPMEIDHIIPEALGGLTEEDNLWLACSLCNDHKGDKIAALDPETGEVMRLFDPLIAPAIRPASGPNTISGPTPGTRNKPKPITKLQEGPE